MHPCQQGQGSDGNCAARLLWWTCGTSLWHGEKAELGEAMVGRDGAPRVPELPAGRDVWLAASRFAVGGLGAGAGRGPWAGAGNSARDESKGPLLRDAVCVSPAVVETGPPVSKVPGTRVRLALVRPRDAVCPSAPPVHGPLWRWLFL